MLSFLSDVLRHWLIWVWASDKTWLSPLLYSVAWCFVHRGSASALLTSHTCGKEIRKGGLGSDILQFLQLFSVKMSLPWDTVHSFDVMENNEVCADRRRESLLAFVYPLLFKASPCQFLVSVPFRSLKIKGLHGTEALCTVHYGCHASHTMWLMDKPSPSTFKVRNHQALRLAAHPNFHESSHQKAQNYLESFYHWHSGIFSSKHAVKDLVKSMKRPNALALLKDGCWTVVPFVAKRKSWKTQSQPKHCNCAAVRSVLFVVF